MLREAHVASRSFRSSRVTAASSAGLFRASWTGEKIRQSLHLKALCIRRALTRHRGQLGTTGRDGPASGHKSGRDALFLGGSGIKHTDNSTLNSVRANLSYDLAPRTYREACA